MPWYSVFSFLFLCLETTLQERNWVKTTSVAVMVFFLESIIPKELDHNVVQGSLSTLTKHLDNGIDLTTEDFMDIGVKSSPRH